MDDLHALLRGKLLTLLKEDLDVCLGSVLQGGKSFRLGVTPGGAAWQRLDPGAPAAIVLFGELSGKYIGRHRGNPRQAEIWSGRKYA